MGSKRKLIAAGLLMGSMGLAAACEPPPPPPPPATTPKTPENLVSNAEYDAVTEGMTLAEVEGVLHKELDFDYESSFDLGGDLFITRSYDYEGELGNCFQYVQFSFYNADRAFEHVVPGELRLSGKYREESECEGIVK